MTKRSLLCSAWSCAAIALAAPAANAQDLSQAEIEALLARAVTHVLESQPEGKYTRPVLVSAHVDKDVARLFSIDSIGLTEAVSRIARVPIWDGKKYCDTSRRVHHWRMENADFRVSPTLASLSGDTAAISVALSGSPSMAGITVRTLQLVRSGAEWTALGFSGSVMHASSVPCHVPPEADRHSAGPGVVVSTHRIARPL